MKKIMVLDNDPDLLDLLQIFLEDEQFEVKVIEETEDILSLVNSWRPDLLLVDFSLNGVNGGELCKQVKNNSVTAAMPVIMLSAYQKLFVHPEDYGCDVFIAKPFDLQELVDRIRELTRLKIAGAGSQ